MLETTHLSGLANHLISNGLLHLDQALLAESSAKKYNIPFITYLVMNRIMDGNAILQSCTNAFGFPIFDWNERDESLLSSFNAELILRHRIIPLKKDNHLLSVGFSDPTNRHALTIFTFHTGAQIKPFLINENDLIQLIETHFAQTTSSNRLELSLLKELTTEDFPTAIQENSVTYDEPLIKFVDHIIQHALKQSASDIHIEPFETICRIRYRQDGILYQVAEIPIALTARLISRLKIMARLDISERRLPQDGRFQLNSIDFRINTCPTLFGEKIVLRILDSKKTSLNIPELGFTQEQQSLFIEKITRPQGLILVTGPTGSGKSVTLYSALNYLNTLEKNISTVEDPIEIQLNGINQVNINPKINLHFATALRTFLRQDPDIIMIGEIRDTETAEIAIQAAQTGHLVLSTLHTNSAIETITRLTSMNIAKYNLSSSISLIIAQRLIRKLCEYCKQPETLDAELCKEMSLESTNIYRAVGCSHCLQGYHGRIGIYELLPITQTLSQLILSTQDSTAIVNHTQQEGFLTLREAGLKKVIDGITTLSEINRVIIK